MAGLGHGRPPPAALPPPPSTPRPTAEEILEQSLENSSWDPDSPMPATEADIRDARKYGA